MTHVPRTPLAREASERREGQYLRTTERRERSILPPAASGIGEAGLRPAKADAGEGRA